MEDLFFLCLSVFTLSSAAFIIGTGILLIVYIFAKERKTKVKLFKVNMGIALCAFMSFIGIIITGGSL